MASKRTNRSAMLAVALIFALVAAGGVFAVLYSFQKQTSYWVVNTQIDARTKITSSSLKEVKVREGSQPTTAMTASYVDSHDVYAKYKLEAGDILTASNAGALEKITAGIPNDYSVSSFTVSATNAAVGMAKRGDYIDIYVVDNSNGQTASTLALQHVLVLDAVASLDQVSARDSGATTSGNSTSSTTSSSGTGSSSSSATSTVSTIYQVGLSRQDTAKLAYLSTKELFVALSPATGASAPTPSEVTGLTSSPTDSGAGTDSTFGDSKASQSASSSSTSSSATSQSGN